MLISNSFLALAAAVPASAAATKTTAALDLAVGVDGDAAGPLATAAAVSRQSTPYVARDSAPSLHKNADLGVLALKQRQAQASCDLTCPAGFFGYCDGAPISSDVCDGDCCTGDGACIGFTGCVKGDGSCAGYFACRSANIPMIVNSCKGPTSCNAMGYYGTVGPITKSCNGLETCYMVAAVGNMGPITNSCNRDNACTSLARYGSIKSIENTCNNEAHKPCAILASSAYDPSSHGNFGHVTKFVHTETGEKYTWDSIGSIVECHDACVMDTDCNGIKWKGHTGRPCRFFGGPISENKCSGRNVCITVE